MKSEKLIDALGKIEDSLVLEITPAAMATKKIHRWPLWLAAAAMAALCFFGAYKLGLRHQPAVDTPQLQENPEDPEVPEETPADPTAEALRAYLQGFTPSTADQINPDDARVVLTDYIETHPHEFRYLPTWQQARAADWEALTLFAVKVGGFTDTLTAQELEDTVAIYMDQKITHQSSSELQYGNGLYTVMARGVADGPMCYTLQSITMTTSNVYDIVLVGVAFGIPDLLEDPAEYSYNRALLQAQYGDVTAENLESRMYDYLREYGLGSFRISERLTIKVRLQEGDHPFHYLSCKRETIEAPTFTDEEYEALREKLYALPYAYGWDPGSRHAFLNYFMDDPWVMEAYGSWDMVSIERKTVYGKVMDVLTCNGPLHVTTGESQCFLYDPETEEVLFGPSGTWTTEEYDAAEALRRTLLTETGSLGESLYIREAVARYYAENPEALESYREFGETDLVCYSMMNCRLVDANDRYATFELTLAGIGFTEDDWSADPDKWSYNRQKLEELAAEPVDQTNYRQLILPYLYETHPLNSPFAITEQVRLQMCVFLEDFAGITVQGALLTVPFWYISAVRTEIPPVMVLLEETDVPENVERASRFTIAGRSTDTVGVALRFNAPVRQFLLGSARATETGFTVQDNFYVKRSLQDPGDVHILNLQLKPQVYTYGISVTLENGQVYRYALTLSEYSNELIAVPLN